MKYLVIGSKGPGFTSQEEAAQLINNSVLPSLEQLSQWEAEKKIIAGGVFTGGRTLAWILDVGSHDELDELLRSFVLWGQLDWEVIPLTDFSKRKQIDSKDI